MVSRGARGVATATVLVVQPSSEHPAEQVRPRAGRAPDVGPAAAALFDAHGPVEVRRSRKRLRTVTAYREGDRTIVAIPARFTRAQEREWVARMLARLANQERRRRPSDAELMQRAVELSTRYLSGRAEPASVVWATNQGRRWGSCTPSDRTIRISDRLRGMPSWVLDYVLLHELAHLLHAGHGPEFWAELDAYPRTGRARGFLEGYSYGEEHAEEPREGRPAAVPVVDEVDEVEDDTPDVEAHEQN